MRSSLLSIVLAVSLAGSAVAAGCADTTPMPTTPAGAGSSTAPTAPVTAPPATTPAPVDTAPPSTSGKGPTAPPPDAAANDKPMPAIGASKMGDDLKGIGLDIAKLPTMAKLKQPERIKVMNALSKATGLACNDCHVEDRKKETPMKTISRHMWDDYVVTMKMSDGGPLFCDSCHQGKHDFLTRSNKEAVRKFMDANYVDKIAQKDAKGQQTCQTCHGQEFEMKIFEKVWKAKREAPKAEFFLGEKAYIGMADGASY